MFEYDFMRNAFVAVLLMTPILGILGTMVVNNRMAFFSDAIGHSALTGIAIGVLVGISDPMWAMVIFALIFSIIITYAKNMTKTSTDTVIGVFSSTAVAAGIVILSKGGGFNKYSSYLIGDLLSITHKDILMLVIVFVFILFFWATAFNRLLLVSVNQSLPRSRGVNIRAVEILFTIVMAVVVTISIRWVGLLIINSLLVLPAATARNLSVNTKQYHIFSVATALSCGIGGLILSYYWNTATGATIVLLTAVLYFGSLFFKSRIS
jgi:zinc transport system permease protein